MRFAVGAEREAQRFLGAGLADRAGDGNHLPLEARARGAAEIAQGFEHIVNEQAAARRRRSDCACRGR